MLSPINVAVLCWHRIAQESATTHPSSTALSRSLVHYGARSTHRVDAHDDEAHGGQEYLARMCVCVPGFEDKNENDTLEKCTRQATID